MSSVAPADVLVAAPVTGDASPRNARASSSRFGEVLDAAGLALADTDADAVEECGGMASGGGAQGTPDADRQTTPPLVPAGVLMVPTPVITTSSWAETSVGEVPAVDASAGGNRASQGEGAAEMPLTGPAPTEGGDTAASALAPAAAATIAPPPASGEPADAARVLADGRRVSAPAAPADAAPTVGPTPPATEPGQSGEQPSIPTPLGVAADVRATTAPSRASVPIAASGLAPTTATTAPAAYPIAPAPASSIPVADGAPAATPPSPTVTAAAPTMSPVVTTPVDAPASASSTARAVAAQVSPVVVSIAQRPAGTHQLTLTVNPDTLGPVTVRAHIGQGGDVRVELIGATDAGRDALRTMVADLRRDLAAAMPHATLSIAQGAGAEPGADRGGQPLPGGAGDEGGAGRGSTREAPRDRASAEAAVVPTHSPTTTAAAPGSGLDILA